MLLFKKKFLPAIRSGEKTQTIRLWKFRHMRAGQRSYIPGVGRSASRPSNRSTSTRSPTPTRSPTASPRPAALQHELRTIYGEKLAPGHKAFRIVFECVAESKSPEPSVKGQNRK